MYKRCLLFAAVIAFYLFIHSQDNLLKIETALSPKNISPGSDVILKLRMLPQNSCRISSHPELVIRFNDNEWLVFAKMFFSGSEFNFPTIQDKDGVYVNIDRDIEIPFKIKNNAPLGTIELSGEVSFTALFQGSCFVKTFQTFTIPLTLKKKGTAKRGN